MTLSPSPGPWKAVEHKSGGWNVQAANGYQLASLLREADARLIAAAPDLLAALKALQVVLTAVPPGIHPTPAQYDAHDRALARAQDVLARLARSEP
jgi:hypothetical protein